MKSKQMMLSIGLSLLLVGCVITVEVLTSSDSPKIANADTTDTLLVPENIVSNTESPDTTIDSPIETLVADIAKDAESSDFEQLNIDTSDAEFLVIDQAQLTADSAIQSSSSVSGSINNDPIIIIASSPYGTSPSSSTGGGGGGSSPSISSGSGNLSSGGGVSSSGGSPSQNTVSVELSGGDSELSTDSETDEILEPDVTGFAVHSTGVSLPPVELQLINTRNSDLQVLLENQFTAGDRMFMPLGMYAVSIHLCKEGEMVALRKNGIKFVHRYTGKELTIDRSRMDLACAKNADIPMAYNLPTRTYHEGKNWWHSYISARDLYDETQIVFWKLHGEPTLSEVWQLETVTDLIHENDTYSRPVISYHNDTDQVVQRMCGFLDAVVFGAYPGTSMDKGYPRVRIAYNLRFVYKYGGVPIAALESYKTPSGWPDPDHIEYDAYLSLINGAKGIMWYCYEQVRKRPDLLEAIFEVSRLLNGPKFIGEVFLKGEKNTDVKAEFVSGPKVFTNGFHKGMQRDMPNNPSVHWRAFNHREKTYLAMVNTCEKLPSHVGTEALLTVELEFTGLPSDSDIKLLDGDCSYRWNKEALRVNLKPLEVGIFEID